MQRTVVSYCKHRGLSRFTAADIPFEVTYRRGWPEGTGLGDALSMLKSNAIFKVVLPILVFIETTWFDHAKEVKATEVLSRGQSKRLCIWR